MDVSLLGLAEQHNKVKMEQKPHQRWSLQQNLFRSLSETTWNLRKPPLLTAICNKPTAAQRGGRSSPGFALCTRSLNHAFHLLLFSLKPADDLLKKPVQTVFIRVLFNSVVLWVTGSAGKHPLSSLMTDRTLQMPPGEDEAGKRRINHPVIGSCYTCQAVPLRLPWRAPFGLNCIRSWHLWPTYCPSKSMSTVLRRISGNVFLSSKVHVFVFSGMFL